jgi:hypothetical protein
MLQSTVGAQAEQTHAEASIAPVYAILQNLHRL